MQMQVSSVRAEFEYYEYYYESSLGEIRRRFIVRIALLFVLCNLCRICLYVSHHSWLALDRNYYTNYSIQCGGSGISYPRRGSHEAKGQLTIKRLSEVMSD